MLTAMTSIGLVLSAVLATADPAAGESEAKRQIDLVTYNRLLTEVNQIDREYGRTLNQAMREARGNGGKADLETLAALLSLRDRRDRVMARVTMMGLRHGWGLPGSHAKGSGEKAGPMSGKEQVFHSADQIIKARFAQEAIRIAEAIDLPLIGPPATGSDRP